MTPAGLSRPYPKSEPLDPTQTQLTHKPVAEPSAIRLDPAGGGMWKMHGQHQSRAARMAREELAPGLCSLHRIGAEAGRPFRFPALQSVVHEVPDHNRLLP